MAVTIGEIVDGKVVKTTNFGAFVRIEEGVEGLVHISELSHDFVKNVEDVVNEGDEVKVKVISNKDGKIALSIKDTQEKDTAPKEFDWLGEDKRSKDMSFEDKLNQFMKESNENLQQVRTRENKKNNRRKNNSNN